MVKLKNLPKYHFFTCLVAGLCFFHLLINTVWLQLDNSPLGWDQASHTYNSTRYTQFFNHTLADRAQFWTISNYYPPLTYWIIAIIQQFFNISATTPVVIISLYFIALIILTYLTAKELYKSQKIGFWTTFLLSFFCLIYGYSRSFLLELPQLTVLALSFYLLLKTHNFTNSKYIIFFAIAAVAALLTKWTTAVYLVVPSIFCLIQGIRTKSITSKHLIFVAIVGMLALVLILPWYIFNFDTLSQISKVSMTGEIGDPQAVFSLENLTFYLNNLRFHLGPIPAALTLALTVIYCVKRHPYWLLFLSYIAMGWIVFTFLGNKDARYIEPLTLAFPFILAFFLVDWWQNKKWYLFWLPGSVATLLVIQFFLFSFRPFPESYSSIPLPKNQWFNFWMNVNPYVAAPVRISTNHTALLDFLVAKRDEKPLDYLPVYIGADVLEMNPSLLTTELALRNVYRVQLMQLPIDVFYFTDEVEMINWLQQFTYFVIPEGEVASYGSRYMGGLEQIKAYVETHSSTFVKVFRFKTNSQDTNTHEFTVYQFAT